MKRQRPSNSQRLESSSRHISPKKSKKGTYPNPSPASTHPNYKSNRNWKQWKQHRSHDYNTHQFLDSSATVHAGLFGARRLPEIKSLWRHVVHLEGNFESNLHSVLTTTSASSRRKVGESGGGKISSRHLRRRTGSHKRRRRNRFPRGAESSNYTDSNNNNEETSEQLNQQKGQNTSQLIEQKCRRARRKPSLLKQAHSSWWNQELRQQITENHKDYHWLPTHLWHAKRFHLSSSIIFSWAVPLLHTNRGSRASLRLATSQANPKCTLQDATWEIDGCAVVLRANQGERSSNLGDEIVDILKVLLERITDIELDDDCLVSGQRSVEGLIHEIDSLPTGLVGPGTFLFKPMNGVVSCSKDDIVSIFVHPAIRLKVMNILSSLIEKHDSDIEISIEVATEPYSLLRVRGVSSTATVAKVLTIDWADVLPNYVDVDKIDDGTLLKIKRPLITSTAKQSSSQIILKSHRPNQYNIHLKQNVACSGWDILCHPSIFNDLFQAFVREGGSCAIGLVENARARLEASPPLPTFPRDYPDSTEGKLYWEGKSEDWKIIRNCIEGSWGRNNQLIRANVKVDCRETPTEEPEKLKCKKCKSLRINWPSIVSSNNNQSVIVVRGSFGAPFLQLLHGCGRFLDKVDPDNSKRQKRRPRRAMRPSNLAVHVPPLSKSEKEAHSKLCQQLKASLSLPALLRCEVFFVGKGLPSVGDFIFSFTARGDNSVKSADNQIPLGLVIAGCFSPTRGRSIGVAFVSAAKFIDALDGTEHGMVKDDSMFLEVAVANGTSPTHLRRSALLSLLL